MSFLSPVYDLKRERVGYDLSGFSYEELAEDLASSPAELETVLDEEGRLWLPGRFEVCGRCDGRGTHDHEAFEGGFTAEDLYEDPDFAEDYLSGVYDVQCSECGGRTTVLEVDREQLQSCGGLRERLWLTIEQWRSEAAQERAWERRNRSLGIEY